MFMAPQKGGSENLGVLVYLCNASTWEAEVGGSRVQGQPGLRSKKKKSKKVQVLRLTSIIPATWEAEIGEEGQDLRPGWAKSY
jgi:hypothetical protein